MDFGRCGMNRDRRTLSTVRTIVQLSAFVFFNSILLGMFSFGTVTWLKNVFAPNAACRYIQNAPTYCYLYNLQEGLAGGLQTYYFSVFVLLLVVIILTLIVGRVWCGWLCPLGFAQDLLLKLRKSLGIPHKQLPFKAYTFLKHFKWAFLLFVILIAILIGIPQFGLNAYSTTLALPLCQTCPAKPLFLLLQQAVGLVPSSTTITLLSIAILLIFFVGSFGIRMFWCRLCPIGALISPLNRVSLLWLKKDGVKCTKCRICLRTCPMDINKIYEERKERNVTYTDCTLCLRCVETCPEDDCLSLNFMSRRVVGSKHPWRRLMK